MSEEKKIWPATPPPTPEEVYKDAPEEWRKHSLFLEEIFRDPYKKPEALDGVRVLETGVGKWITMVTGSYLAELGAEVVKIEPPGGDPLRWLTPFGREDWYFRDVETGELIGAEFLNEMRNKYSVTLNLEHPKGQEIFKKVVKHFDVVIDGWPPGQMEKWGLGYKTLSEINPRLVYCWVGIWGRWGPNKDKPGWMEPMGQAICGYWHQMGFPEEVGDPVGRPTRSGAYVEAYAGGIRAAFAIVAALYYRDEVSGRGQAIEVAGAETLAKVTDSSIPNYGFDGFIRPRFGNWDPQVGGYCANPCKDGFVFTGVFATHHWQWFAEKLLPKLDPKLREIAMNPEDFPRMDARLSPWAMLKCHALVGIYIRDKTRYEVEQDMASVGLAGGPGLYIDEVAEYTHYKYRGDVREVDDEHYGTVLICAPPLQHQHRTPARVKWIGRPLGHDNYWFYLRYAGLSWREVDKLKEEGVI